MEIPTIETIMTRAPRVVDALEDVRTTQALMDQYGIRHLPVIEDGKLLGIVSERDLRAAMAFLSQTRGEIGPPVMALCSRDPLVVAPTDRIDAVADQMGNRRLGSAVVVDDDVVIGIVTTVDICRVLAQLVRKIED